MDLPKLSWELRDKERFYLLAFGRTAGEYLHIVISLEKNEGNWELIEYYKGRNCYHRRTIGDKANLDRVLAGQIEQGKRNGLEYEVIKLQKQESLNEQIVFLKQHLEKLN